MIFKSINDVKFENLKILSLSHMNLNFDIFDKIKNYFINVEELILCHN